MVQRGTETGSSPAPAGRQYRSANTNVCAGSGIVESSASIIYRADASSEIGEGDRINGGLWLENCVGGTAATPPSHTGNFYRNIDSKILRERHNIAEKLANTF
jgi:hypothetical protein